MTLRARIVLPLLLLAGVFAAIAVPVTASPMPVEEDPVVLVHRVAELVDQQREKAGLLPLRWNDSLAAAGAAYAKELATRNFFAHNSPEGSTPVSRAKAAGYQPYGWGGLYVGENLARGYSTAEGAMQGWMNSEEHRNNLLNPGYRETGVGMAVAASGAVVLAQEFGSRPKMLPVFIDGDADSTDTPKVTLSISAEDVSSWGSLGKVTQMEVSNNASFAGASWEPYARTKNWTLTSQLGLKTVYVRLRDQSGATVDSRDTIVLEDRQKVALEKGLGAQPAAPAAAPKTELEKGLAGKPRTADRSDGSGDWIQSTAGSWLVRLKEFNWASLTSGFTNWVTGLQGILRL